MTPEQAAAFVSGQAACLNAEIEAMKAANLKRVSEGAALAYSGHDFRDAINDYQCHHNAAIEIFDQANRQ